MKSPLGAGRGGFIALPLLFLLLFFYLPLGLILGETFSRGFDGFWAIWSNPYYWGIIRFTFIQALASTLFSLFLGIPGAYLLGRHAFPGKRIVKSLTTLPFVLPSILVVLGFVLFWGNNGSVNRWIMGMLNLKNPPLKILYTFKAIILAHGFYNFPIIMRLVGNAWAHLPANQIQAARSLGAGRGRLFRSVTLPHLLPSLFSASSLVFLFCFMSFAVILVLGGGPRYSTLEVEVYRLAKFTLDLPSASILGVTGAVLSLFMLSLNLFLQKRAARSLGRNSKPLPPRPLWGVPRRNISSSSGAGKALEAVSRGVFLIYLLVLGVILLGPLVSVGINSLLQKATWGSSAQWSLKWYKQLFFPPPGTAARGVSLAAVFNSLRLALGATALALPVGTLFALWTHRGGGLSRGRRAAEVLLMLPLGISSVILGLGYLKLLTFLPYKGGYGAIVGAHAVIGYPFVIRSVSASLHRVIPSLRHAAASLGASPGRVLLTLEVPLIRGGILSGAAFAFALSLGEINATILLSRPGTITLPLAIYRLIGAYNFYGACVLGTLLMVLCTAAFFIIDRFEENAHE